LLRFPRVIRNEQRTRSEEPPSPSGSPGSAGKGNTFAIYLADAVRNTGIKVNSAHPGWVKTEMVGIVADPELSEGGKTSAQLATLPDDGPTGGHFHMGEVLPW
jgi:NAD(P)-dependent dehydrogenase (short-subunit alcohol dehydrogenase family)